MSDALKEFLNSGKKIITDTKQPKSLPTKKQVPLQESLSEPSGDRHQVFIKRTIREKPKKTEILEEFKKFVEQAEKEL
jgi:hypothetical protein